jgi:hypothetical protein
MHDSKDKDDIGSYLVNDTIWKTVGSTPACSVRQNCPGFGILNNPFKSAPHFDSELETRPLALAVVVFHRLNEFGFGNRKEFDFHERSLVADLLENLLGRN